MHSRSHTASVPNLHRAVAECTQPYGPPASVAAVRSLQVRGPTTMLASLLPAHFKNWLALTPAQPLLLQAYLTDDSCVDAVYRAILARACAEPQR
jgi:hypothetical protein